MPGGVLDVHADLGWQHLRQLHRSVGRADGQRATQRRVEHGQKAGTIGRRHPHESAGHQPLDAAGYPVQRKEEQPVVRRGKRGSVRRAADQQHALDRDGVAVGRLHDRLHLQAGVAVAVPADVHGEHPRFLRQPHRPAARGQQRHAVVHRLLQGRPQRRAELLEPHGHVTGAVGVAGGLLRRTVRLVQREQRGDVRGIPPSGVVVGQVPPGHSGAHPPPLRARHDRAQPHRPHAPPTRLLDVELQADRGGSAPAEVPGLHQVGQRQLPVRRARDRGRGRLEGLPGGDEHRGGVLAVLADRTAALTPPPGIGAVVHRRGLVAPPLAPDHHSAELARRARVGDLRDSALACVRSSPPPRIVTDRASDDGVGEHRSQLLEHRPRLAAEVVDPGELSTARAFRRRCATPQWCPAAPADTPAS